MKIGIAILAAIGMLLTDSICVGAQNNASDDLEDIIIAVSDNMVTVPKNQEEEAIEELFSRAYDEENGIVAYASAADIASVTVVREGEQVIPTTPLKTSENIINQSVPLYRLKFKVTVKANDGRPVANCAVVAVTSGNTGVAGIKTINTNSMGIGYIEIDVRGVNTVEVKAVCKRMGTALSVQSAAVRSSTVLSCNYESQFYVIAYIVAKESDYTGGKVSASGITGSYRSDFLAAVKLNGTGYTADGKYIRYNSNTSSYAFVTEPTTATGTVPAANRTIAVDSYYIPLVKINSVWRRGIVQIFGIGERVAEDKGGAIQGYRIDEYRGIGRGSLTGFSNGNRTVKYIRTQ